MKSKTNSNYDVLETAGGEAETSARIDLKKFKRSTRLSEIRPAYKSRTKLEERTPIRQPDDVTRYLRAIWNPRTLELSEDFVVLCLNNAHQVIGWVRVSSGGFSCAQIDPRVIFAIALQTGSSALVLAHNHPSGDLSPSDEDQRVTKALVEAGRLLHIRILDHVILSKEAAFSFRDHDLF